MSVQGYSGSYSYAPLGSAFRPHIHPGECRMSEYLETADEVSQSYVKSLASATFSIGSLNGDFYGNGVAIAEDLVLVSGHCFHEEGYVGRFRGKVIFDGTLNHLDFKIVQLEPGSCISPVTLDATPACGNALQLYFKIEASGKLARYVKSFEADMSSYSQRSDIASILTSPGESGAPRMSLTTGCVYAIHQGESEGLKVSDIYEVLEQTSQRGGLRGAIAAGILDKIDVRGLDMRFMNQSTIQLKSGDVEEEKPRCKGTVQIGNYSFGYAEEGEGREKRKIGIYLKGQPNAWIYYAIDDINPHKKSGRYDNEALKFYNELAQKLGENFVENERYPEEIEVKVFGKEFTLTKVENE